MEKRAQRIPSWPGVIHSNKGRIHLRRPTCGVFKFRLRRGGGPYISLAARRRTIHFACGEAADHTFRLRRGGVPYISLAASRRTIHFACCASADHKFRLRRGGGPYISLAARRRTIHFACGEAADHTFACGEAADHTFRLRDVTWLADFLDVRLLWCKEPKLSLLTQVSECGAGLKALGKFLFIGRQAGANQTSVGEGKAKLLHFLFGFLRRPTLSGHTVGRNHHSRAVVTHTAMDENLLTWIVSKQCKELRERFIFWKGTLPGHCHVLHTEMCHDLALSVARPTQVYHDIDPHLCQGAKSLFGGLTAAV